MTIEIVDLPISMVIFQFAMLVHQRVHHFMDGFWWNIHQKMDDWGFNSVPGLQALIVPSCLGYPWEKPKLWPHKFDQTYGQKPSDQNSGFYETNTNQKTPRLLLISWSPAQTYLPPFWASYRAVPMLQTYGAPQNDAGKTQAS